MESVTTVRRMCTMCKFYKCMWMTLIADVQLEEVNLFSLYET